MKPDHKIAGIMGPGEKASPEDIHLAYECGKCCAQSGYTVLTGGRKAGVMDAALRGAKEAGGKTIGILPDAAYDVGLHSEHIDVPILTGMGQARNVINVLSSDIIIGIGMGPGTLSEISLAVKHEKKVLLLNWEQDFHKLFKKLDSDLIFCDSVNELIEHL